MNFDSNTYEIKLPHFEGPFDLLLFFIERDELDIYDIPIAKITTDFLEYLHQAQQLNIELASDFILVASTLMRIKAKMLIPRKELDEQGNEIDPRKELVQKLLEYKQLKSVFEEFKVLEANQSLHFKRAFVAQDIKEITANDSSNAELETLTLYKLLHALKRVMLKFDERHNTAKHTVIQYPFTIESKKEYILHLASEKDKTSFEKVFETCTSRIEAIFSFLALLEMIQQKLLSIEIGLGKNNFWISLYNVNNPVNE